MEDLVLKKVPFLSSFPGAFLKGLVEAMDFPGLALLPRFFIFIFWFLDLLALGIFPVMNLLEFIF